MKKIILFCLTIICINYLYSTTIEELAVSDEWHNLLLDDAYGKGFVTDYSSMFACGERDYKKEIEFLIENQNEELYYQYPARYECISRNLHIDIPYLDNNHDLTTYLELNSYDTLSISFSEPINDELDSTFGHAFIILNNIKDNIGNGASINLFAYIDDLDSLEMIKKGLTGDLVGYFDFAQAGIGHGKIFYKITKRTNCI